MSDAIESTKCAALLKALADAGRLRIVQALRERPQNVSDLAALLDDDIKNVSHHLKVLRRHGLVANRRVGKTVVYSLADEVFRPRKAHGDRLEFGCCRLELPGRNRP